MRSGAPNAVGSRGCALGWAMAAQRAGGVAFEPSTRAAVTAAPATSAATIAIAASRAPFARRASSLIRTPLLAAR